MMMNYYGSSSTGDAPSEASSSNTSYSLEGPRVYFVPYKWWKEVEEESGPNEDKDEKFGILYTASPHSYEGASKYFNFFNSDIVFDLKREDNILFSEPNGEDFLDRDCVLLSENMWLKALKWHKESKATAGDAGFLSMADDATFDVYPLQLRLFVIREANLMTARISKKDNAVYYKAASKIFNFEDEPMRIWDYSGQTDMFFNSEGDEVPKHSSRQMDQEMLLELQVYGLPELVKSKCEGKKDDLAIQPYKSGFSLTGGMFMGNGSIASIDTDFGLANPLNLTFSGSSGREGSLGLTGLQNLGNTCFMNSALQCLVHTPKLFEYFLGDYSNEINQHNPLGMDGELALAFGQLVRKLWAPGRTPVAPREFKSKLARFAPQFSGYNQHDSQELLAFLLDGLHEDLNRVKSKPYIETKDADGRPDEEVADEYWHNHLARNDSIIVDACQGQYKSTLVCPDCNKVSVTFDPFMYLSLPLPSTTMRAMTITVFSCDGSTLPMQYTINVPKFGKCKDLIQALSIACSLRRDETLLVAEIFSNKILRFLEDPSDSISLIRDADMLAAYRLPTDLEKFPLVVFMHQRDDEFSRSHWISSGRKFGIPLVARLKGINVSHICHAYHKLLSPFLISRDSASQGSDTEKGACEENSTLRESFNGSSKPYEGIGNDNTWDDHSYRDIEFEFYLTDEEGRPERVALDKSKPVQVTSSSQRLRVLVCWPEKAPALYDIPLLNTLREVYKPVFFMRRPEAESISLNACLEAFLKEEPLGPEDMWYCPGCKEHRQASKKLDLWRLPEILVVHLKRFSYSHYIKNKLEMFVDFPIHDLDLSSHIARKELQSSTHYELYAVSNHYGGLGGGHYTAYVHHSDEKGWYDFDDSRVTPITEDQIKSSAAYVLFYRRVGAIEGHT
ncbi:ubiquitin carboxyl-terminal hydrolase 8 [Amborella trichopoda]|uniref:Ubiquitin carboxyl-terminal hydrolase n=1 Tax=Amborella trichopoda TaxID=13333 RepID=W1NDK1_AMBTC|nr:ubiquitin carboxyl-terminal hydrolase 8 [Amborella trichopoda]ERM93667.1 hypothetical protein AMTR_s00004p00166400 [Amborella trichopoda]|eukprot:XP_006826430.1 ubiquitin carboxyl-terminal hydrolase 8 [Amborella trichopoda]